MHMKTGELQRGGLAQSVVDRQSSNLISGHLSNNGFPFLKWWRSDGLSASMSLFSVPFSDPLTTPVYSSFSVTLSAIAPFLFCIAALHI